MKQFREEWEYFCSRINFKESAMDSRAIRFMNEFNSRFNNEVCEIIGEWYVDWKGKIVDGNTPHRLGFAKEELKNKICLGGK